MRALAESGSLHVGLSPDQWSEAAKQALRQETIGDVIGLNELFTPQGALPGAGSNYRANVLLNMPWLQKAPVTDKLYGVGDTYALQETMGMAHLLDEMKNALDPRSGLPPELMLRPESLGRMSLPAAAERVSLINQFRAKEMERAALSNLDSPAVQTFKEYAENNPLGLRWTELKAPDAPEPPADWGWQTLEDGSYLTPEGKSMKRDPDRVGGFLGENEYYHHPLTVGGTKAFGKKELEDALKYEGDTMGHCVGGYCDDVMQGRSRIFSLRDAKGEPHVTIETSPSAQWRDVEHAADEDPDFGDAWNAWRYGYDISRAPGRPQGTFEEYLRTNEPDLLSRFEEQGSSPDRIVQIKGKQNRAPKDDYLPFVQDFVKSGQWGNVGDLGNAGLVKLPDGRYITQQQWGEGLNAVESPWRDPGQYDERYLDNLSKAEWEYMAPYFKGYAIGGRVSADRCFCHHPMSVKR